MITFFSSFLKNWEFWKSHVVLFLFFNISCVSSLAFVYLRLCGWLGVKFLNYFCSYNGSVYSAEEGPDRSNVETMFHLFD